MVPAEENLTAVFNLDSCLNCTQPPVYDVNLPKVVTMVVVFMIFLLFGVMGNVLVIMSVVCHQHLRSVTHCFIANLAVADLLLSSVVVPLSASSEALGRWVLGRALCGVWASLDVLCSTASIFNLCVISVDRWLAVTYPLRYLSLATSKRAVGAMVAVWVASAGISVGPLFGWREPMPDDESVCSVNEDPGYAIFSASCSFYIPLTVILIMYCKVYMVARRKARRLTEGQWHSDIKGGAEFRIHRGNAQRCHAERGKEDEGSRKGRSYGALVKLLSFSKEMKAAKTLGIVVGCFILCWLPFFLVLPLSSIFPSHRPSDTVFKITFWLGYFNSCLNPIIYPCFSQEFKKAFQNVLKGLCFHRATHTHTTTTTNITPLTQISPHPALPSRSVTLSTSRFTHTGADRVSKSLLKACCSTGGKTSSTETRHVLVDMKGVTGGQAV
ncbi:alpha-1A adrenergic receptor [Tachysurus fulvidraco]|uniref:alpha-1A adrenergic receptor n=1 Tax=Tachysurus fulvidraco TaxID=1234273 RepID=UPI000F4FAF30|nr:alpha-1A adrenergic receptor [Tachysurus fulvidraco]